MKKITVFGATGMLGKPVTKELLKAGFEITAMVRNPEKAKEQLPQGVKLLKGDLNNPSEIENALQDADFVYINLSVLPESRVNDFQPEREGFENLMMALKKANIKRVAYCASLVQHYQGVNGFNWWVFDIKEKAIQLIKESGIPYTLFYPSSFMENFATGGYRQGKRVVLAGKSKFKMYFISGEDFGRQVARSFEILDTENKEYAVQGLEAMTSDEAANVFVKHYQKEKLSISKAPLGLLKFFGNFIRKLNYGSKIIESLNKYEEKFESETTWQELGKPQITLKDFAAGL